MARARLEAIISADARAFHRTMGRLKGAVTGVMGMLGLGVSIAGIAAAIKGIAAYADSLDDGAKAAGLAVDSFQRLRYAFRIVGAEPEQATRAMSYMRRVIGETVMGSKAYVQTFNALKLKPLELSKLTAEEQLIAIVDALSKVENPARRAASAAKLFGEKASMNLQGLFALPAEELRKLLGMADTMGQVWSPQLVKIGADLDEALRSAFEAARKTFAEGLAPLMQETVERLDALKLDPEAQAGIRDFAAGLGEAARISADILGTLYKWGEALGPIIAPLADLLTGVSAAGKEAAERAVMPDELAQARLERATRLGLPVTPDMFGPLPTAPAVAPGSTEPKASERELTIIREILDQRLPAAVPLL